MFELLISFISILIGCECAKILAMFPVPSISHQVVFRPVMQELAKRGHEVTVITTDPAFPKGEAPQNLIEIDLHDISYELWNDIMKKVGKEKNKSDLLRSLSEMMVKVTEVQLKSDEVQNFIRSNKKIDLLFIESQLLPALILSHIYDVPVIEFSSMNGLVPTFEMMGAATHPFLYPDVLRHRFYNLTLWEKITEAYYQYTTYQKFTQAISNNTGLKSIFGPNIPELKDLRRNVHMLFLNVHPIWDYNRPVPPNVLYLGGLHQKPLRDIPKDLKSYLDSSKNGIIYISFGTNIKPTWFTPEKLKIFTDVFSKLPYDILWKWDKEEIPGRSKNVRISEWLPQSDLLRHPKIKLFITQGGLQSTDEAITAAVPLIGIPMLGDQWCNVEQYVKFNIGKQLSLQTLTEDQLMEAIKTVIGDESYRKNIVKLRNIMRDQPQSPLERAVWWTEHVLRHGGGAHLRTPAAHMHWTEYYELDLLLLVLATFVIVIAVAIFALYFIVSNVRHYMRGKIKVN